jgi:hypothetical protein
LDERGRVVEEKGDSHPKIERWTAGRKADLVLEIIKGRKTSVDAAVEYGGVRSSPLCVWSLFSTLIRVSYYNRFGFLAFRDTQIPFLDDAFDD